MEKSAKILIFLFSLFNILIIGCNKDEKITNPPEPETIIADNTIQVDSTGFLSNLISIDSINVVLKQTSSIAQNAKIGGFLVSNYRQGILRKILNKQTLNNQIVLTTQQARLDEVILRGKIYFKGIVNPQQFLLEAVSDTSIQVYKTPSEITVTFQGVKFGGNSNLSIDAETVFKNPEFVLDVELDYGITKFECYLLVTNESYIQVNTTSNVVAGGEITPPWARFEFPPIPLPIVISIVPKIQFGVGGDINIPVSSNSRFESETTTKIGFGFDNGAQYPIAEVNPSANVSSDLEVEGAYSRNYLIFPKLGLYVVGLLGPYFEQQVSVEGNVARDNGGKYLSFGFGVNGKGGVEFDLFGLLQAGAGIDIYDQEWIIFKNYFAANPPQPPTLLSPSNRATNISLIPTFNWYASSGATSYTLQVSINSSFSSFIYNADVGNVTSKQISGLSNSTTYYWRVNAKNSYGTSEWSSTWFFTTTGGGAGTVTDIDGNVYNIITIGTQVWLVENLKVTHYRNGDSIPNVTDNTQWFSLNSGAYCDYNNDLNHVSTYGRLYNWYAVNDNRCLAPAGWHVPSDAEWNILINYLGGFSVAGGALKETILWQSPNTGATNSSGFSALPGGYRDNSSNFYNIGNIASFWSSTAYSTSWAYYRSLSYDNAVVFHSNCYRIYGLSVRCVRD